MASPEQDTSEEGPSITKFKKRSGRRPMFRANWIMETKFPDEKSAIEHLTTEEIWSIDPHLRYQVHGGRKVHYRCNRATISGAPCSILKCLYFPRDREEVILFKMKPKHKHDKTSPMGSKNFGRPQGRNGVSKKKSRHPMETSLKIRIRNLTKHIQSPKAILLKLESEGFEVKHREIQIRNYCANVRYQKDPIKWKFEKSFDQMNEAKLYLKKQNIWNYHFQKSSSTAIIYQYRCKMVPKTALQCAAQKHINYNKYTKEVTLYQKDCPHTHLDIMKSSNLNVTIKTGWLLNQLHQYNRNALKEQGFRVLDAVGLQDCLIKKKTTTDDKKFTAKPAEVNLYERFVKENKTVNMSKRNSGKPLFKSDWEFEEKFANEQLALDHLAKDDIWSIDPKRIYAVTEGRRKVHYRCNRVKVAGPQCAAWKCLLYSVGSEEVDLYKKTNDHTHDSIASQFRKNDMSLRRCKLKENSKLPKTHIFRGSAAVASLIRKCGQSCKNARKYTVKEENINGQVELELIENIGSELQISQDHSTQCVNSCGGTSGNQLRNPQVGKNNGFSKNTTVTDKSIEWKLNDKIAMDKVSSYLNEQNTWECKYDRGRSTKSYYWCCTEDCEAEMCLFYQTGSTEVFVYRRGNHTHEIGYRTANLPLHFNEARLIPDSYPNSNIIVKEELIINDVLDSDFVSNDDNEQMDTDTQIGQSSSPMIVFDSDTEAPKSESSVLPTMLFKIKTEVDDTTQIIQPTKSIDYIGEILISDSNDKGNAESSREANNDSDKIKVNLEEDEITPFIPQPNTSLNDKKRWILEREFNTAQEATEFLNGEQIWTFQVKIQTNDGLKEFYQCSLVRGWRQQCAAAKYLHIKNKTTPNVVYLYKSEKKHTHDTKTCIARGYDIYDTFNEATKESIKKLIKANHSAKQILVMLALKFDVESEKSLSEWITKMRRNLRTKLVTNLDNTAFIETVETWLTQINKIPDKEDVYFCVDFNIDFVFTTFRCFLTTRRLLKNAVNSNLIHLVSTGSLHWRESPITIVGTTDLDQQFHLFGIAICSNKDDLDYEFIFSSVYKGVHQCHKKVFKPECLITDNNEAVHKAFIKTFGNSSKIGICSQVALTNIFLKLSACSDSDLEKNQIREDILKLQKLSSQNLFSKAVELFFQKWQPRAGVKLCEFLTYFKTDWIDRNSNWFQGFRPFTPQTNKALLAAYDTLKENYTFKQYIPTKTFRYHIQIELEQKSLRYVLGNTLYKPIVQKPTIPMSLYEKAIAWNNLEKQIEIVDSGSEIVYYISTDDGKMINEEKLHKYQMCDQQTLDDFFDIQFSFYCVRRLLNNETLTCSCSNFMENYVCEHSVGMALVLNLLIQIPSRMDQSNVKQEFQ